jgi:uncharacterized Zn-finger protein
MEKDTPDFANDAGVSVIEIGVKAFMCIGVSPPFDHPYIYLTVGDEPEVICPYCSTIFRYNPSIGIGDARPIHPPPAQPSEPAPPVHTEPYVVPPLEPTSPVQVPAQTDHQANRLSWPLRILFWFIAWLIIEVPLAKGLEWIEGEDRHWLASLEAFQQSFSQAVDSLQPWHVYEIFSAQSDVLYSQLDSEIISGHPTAGLLFIPWLAFRFTIGELARDPNRLVGICTAFGLIASLWLSLYVVIRTKPRHITSSAYGLYFMLFGIAGSVLAFSLIFVALKAVMGLGVVALGQFIPLAKLVSSSSLALAIVFALLVRTEHAIVEWLKHVLHRLLRRGH